MSNVTEPVPVPEQLITDVVDLYEVERGITMIVLATRRKIYGAGEGAVEWAVTAKLALTDDALAELRERLAGLGGANVGHLRAMGSA